MSRWPRVVTPNAAEDRAFPDALEQELRAQRICFQELEPLDEAARLRVLLWLGTVLNLEVKPTETPS